MISDILAHAVDELDRYLAWDRDGPGTYWYDGEIRRRIIQCRNEMERIRARLDTPPGGEDSPFRGPADLMDENQTSASPS